MSQPIFCFKALFPKKSIFRSVSWKKFGLAALVLGWLQLSACQQLPQQGSRYKQVPLPETGSPMTAFAPLEGTYWDVQEIKAKAAATFQNKPYLQLNSPDTLTGSTGCNSLTGKFQLQPGNQLTLNTGATRMACAGSLAQEADMLSAIELTRRFSIDDGKLTLLDAQGQTLLRAIAVRLK